jgi:hypothetical protein
MLVGKKEYGTYKDGSSVYKDSRGFYIVQYDPKKAEEYKKYLKGWKEKKATLCLKNKRWRPCTRKNKSK